MAWVCFLLDTGRGHLSPSSVIDWYAKEIATLMEGGDYYCGIRWSFIKVKVGLIAYLADRSEKASVLKTSLLGTYGKQSTRAAEIDHIHLPDCQKCFKYRVLMLLSYRFSIVDLPRCQRCCKWNMESQSNSNGKSLCPARYPQEYHPATPASPNNHPMAASTCICR